MSLSAVANAKGGWRDLEDKKIEDLLKVQTQVFPTRELYISSEIALHYLYSLNYYQSVTSTKIEPRTLQSFD